MDDRPTNQEQLEPVATTVRSSLPQVANAAPSPQGNRKEGRLRFLRRRWLQIFVSGLILLFLVERTLVATGDPNYVPSAILLGAFLVPITFTTYLYERLPNWDVPLPPLAICFIWGGVLGTVVAGTLEDDVMRTLGFLPKVGTGMIEEDSVLVGTIYASRARPPI